MGSTILVKPGLVKGFAIEAGTSQTRKLGTVGSDFYMKLMRSSYDFFSPTEEVTGDGDQQPCFENNLLLYGNVTLVGAMVGAKAIGLYNLVSTSGSTAYRATKNPLGGAASPVLHLFHLGGSVAVERLVFYLHIERISINWNRVGRYVGVGMTGKMSGMTDVLAAALETGTS